MKSKYLMRVTNNGFYYAPVVVIVEFNRFLEAVLLYAILQSLTIYLRLTLVFMWNSWIREKFNFCVARVFASINKICILSGRPATGLSFYEV